MTRPILGWLAPGLLALGGCGAAPPRLDATCPARGDSPDALFADMATRGIHGGPDTQRFRVADVEIVVGWKNLLSGRQLTLSCAYRREAKGWRLLRERVDEGTHTLRVTAQTDPPGLVYRDALGRLLEVVAVKNRSTGGRISR